MKYFFKIFVVSIKILQARKNVIIDVFVSYIYHTLCFRTLHLLS